MADVVDAPAPAAATNTVEEPTRSTDAVAAPAVAEAKPAEGGVIATEGVAQVPATEDSSEANAAATETKPIEPTTETKTEEEKDGAPASEEPATNGTPAAKGATNGKRKSVGGAEKKTPAKKGKKAAPELRLNVVAGEMHMVAMRGYQPWPVIVCDEEMLPETLLAKRPVSALRIDGTYREDFMEGGKNAKDRRYPIMFLGTNEFAWQVNTDLLPFDLDDVKKDVETGKQGKKTKALWEAYQIAAEGHDLAHFKEMLQAHEAAMLQDAADREQEEQEKAEKAQEKADKAAEKSRRKSAAATKADADGDDAEGAASAKKAKGGKKRKKEDETDGENEKPAKTPKTKLKLTNKTPKEASAAKPKKEPKSKKKSSEEAESAPEEPQMTAEELLQKREKQILYLRHRLQKGFLSRDQAPKDEDMQSMDDYFKQLEQYDDLEAEIIKKTKVHKVLKAIMKLEMIPKEEEYNFIKRSGDLLAKWNRALAAADNEPAGSGSASAEPATNGVKHDEDASKTEPKDVAMADAPEDKEKNGTAVETTEAESKDKDGDVAMADTDKEANKENPSIQAAAPAASDSIVPTTETSAS